MSGYISDSSEDEYRSEAESEAIAEPPRQFTFMEKTQGHCELFIRPKYWALKGNPHWPNYNGFIRDTKYEIGKAKESGRYTRCKAATEGCRRGFGFGLDFWSNISCACIPFRLCQAACDCCISRETRSLMDTCECTVRSNNSVCCPLATVFCAIPNTLITAYQYKAPVLQTMQ